MARNRLTQIGSLIDGFHSGYSTVGRVLKDRDLRDVADAKPEETLGALNEGDTAAVQAQIDAGAGMGEARTLASAGRANPTHSLLGQTQATPFTPEQEGRARMLAQAGVLGRYGDLEGSARLRGAVRQEERADKQATRDDQRFGWEQTAQERAGRAAETADADQRLARDTDTQVGDWFKGRLRNPDGTERQATIDDHLAASQHRAALLMQAGKPELAGKTISEHNSQAYIKIQLETAQRSDAIGKTAARLAAGDLGAVRDFYNAYVPDGARVVDVQRGKDGQIVIQRETMAGQPMPPTTLKDTGQMLAALSSFKNPQALYDWSQGEFQRNLQTRADVRADHADSRAGAAAGRAAANFGAEAPLREAKTAAAKLQIELANTDDPVRQQTIERKLGALKNGSRGAGAAADTAHVRDARAIVDASGGSVDMAAALDAVIGQSDQRHQRYVDAALKRGEPVERAVAQANKLMAASGYSQKAGWWVKSGDAGGSVPPDAAAAALRKSPERAAEFDAKYGAGAARRVLGNDGWGGR